MKNKCLVLFFLILGANSYSQGFNEIGFVKNDSYENEGVPISYGFAGGFNYPNNFYLDEIDGIYFFPDASNDIIYRVDTENLQILDPVRLEYQSRIPSSSTVYYGRMESFGNGSFWAGVFFYKSFNDYVTYSYDGNISLGFLINDYIFFNTGNNGNPGNIRAFNILGEELDTEEAIDQLSEYSVLMSLEEQPKILPAHIRMLNSGNYIICGNRYYTQRLRTLIDYFARVYGKNYNEEFVYPDAADFLCYDYDGNSYWVYDYSNELSWIVCFSPTGDLLLKENYADLYKVGYYDDVTDFYHDGDIYLEYASLTGNAYIAIANSEGTHIYKLNRTWGDPNMVTLAINGLDGTDYNDYVYEVLDEFSTEELRLQRNMVFALKDYRFSSTDLLEYYGQFNWYDPEKTIEEASAELTDYQLRFVNYIRELEAARN